MKTAETENNKKGQIPTIEESDRVVKSPAVIKKEQAIEFFKTVDWNAWKKVFAETRAEYERERGETERSERKEQ